MFARKTTILSVVAVVIFAILPSKAAGQDRRPETERRWRNAAAPPQVRGQSATSADDRSDSSDTPIRTAVKPLTAGGRRPIARVTNGTGTLPNKHGQTWREYDISPYTLRVTSTNRPEQAIVDWILRETGYEAWHSEPVALLSAGRRTLHVYHTPEIHQVVAEMVDRFVNTEAETHAFGVRVITIGHPNWRAKAYRLLKPVPVQTQCIQAWIMAKEDASLLLANLQKRTDFREHSSPHLLVNNGQATVVSATRTRTYLRDVIAQPGVWPGFEVQPGHIDEGFSLELSPLLSLDGQMIDAILKCHINQVEKLISVMVDVPSPAAPRQRAKTEVPQLAHCDLQERFRWPVDHTLIVGLGMVPTPVPSEPKPLRFGLPLPGSSPGKRADMLIFVESKGKTGQPPTVTRIGRREGENYRGRY